METRRSFTGHSRRRKTSHFVRVGETVSRLLITVGGMGTIIAVTMVCVFLAWVVYPLFLGATVKPIGDVPSSWSGRPLLTAIDEYQLLGWSLMPDGTLYVYRLDNGNVLERRPLFPSQKLTACSSPSSAEEVAFGFGDGTIRTGRIRFTSRFPEPKDLPQALRNLRAGDTAEFEGGLATCTPEGQVRLHKIKVDLEEAIKTAGQGAVVLIDLSVRHDGTMVSMLTADGKLQTSTVKAGGGNELLIPGVEPKNELSGAVLPIPPRPGKGQPNSLLLSGVGDNVDLVWNDGHLVRVNTKDPESPKVVEEVELLGQEGMTVTALQYQIGKTTLLVGDSSGRVRAWFRTKPAGAETGDRSVLTAAHEFPSPGAAVTSLATSGRTRLMAAGYADGRVRLYYVSSEKFLGEVRAAGDQPVEELVLAPKENGLVALAGTEVRRWSLDPGHPEITFAVLFRPVWYEGYEKPTHVWQTTSASDAYEAKYSFWPLIFGTLKGTFYSLILGMPLALMAAVYTSEFLNPRARSVVKPTIELMASLPSVVLGFLAALVLAVFVANWLAAVLAGIITVPLSFLLAAYLWQLLPEKVGLLLARWRFLFILAVIPAGLGGAALLGPWVERFFFAGDLKRWLDGKTGSGTGGWLFLLLPLSALGVGFVLAQFVTPRMRRLTAGCGRTLSGTADLAKWLAAAVLTVGAAWAIGAFLTRLGFDPRGSIVGTYDQRNSLVVGFMMGFAIIPIIYTIAEDALSSVPEHLRSASLGCGATPWQTARRIIIPTAMSGLFSAVMIGLGRAVGETMIVLMAAGNTPIMDLNVFNGFQTLSAAIAVQLPDAVQNSTHFRVLFAAALTLFAMTFVLNTVAEAVRLRFRRRAYQL
jgi:phosphate transport system permease protein